MIVRQLRLCEKYCCDNNLTTFLGLLYYFSSFPALCMAKVSSQPPMCLPFKNTFGTVRCPVSSIKISWIFPPSSVVKRVRNYEIDRVCVPRSSSSIVSYWIPTVLNNSFTWAANGQYVFEKTRFDFGSKIRSCRI